ncbi:MAG TPA: site-2 protease family protein [Acidimicrobiales bacterium]|jgi:Zn-dependent protease|nr:site-2 protease family protein [Acidimicrobiales bacterium]
MDQRTKRTLWIVAGAVVLVALVRSHHITTDSIILFCVVVPSIILHEVAHGWVANAFGDDTAKRAHRLTLNPVVHVDPVGTLIVPALLSLSGLGLFGWAKPVPVNTGRLRSPRNQGVLVSLAGPATNALLAVASAALFITVFRTSFNSAVDSFGTPSLLARVIVYLSLANIGLMAFNLIPIPPLDGSVLFERLLPSRYWPTYLRIRPYTMFIIMGVVLLNFYLSPNGPLTWALNHLYSWWQNVLGAQ